MHLRKERLEKLICQEISTYLVTDKVRDPRIVGFVTVMRVILNRDLSIAKVYTSVYGSDSDIQKTMIGLNSSAGYVRSMLGKNIRIKVMPEVRFVLDHSIENSEKIEKILKNINEKNLGRDDVDDKIKIED